MVYRFLADVVMVFHGVFLLFFVIGGFIAWRWPKVIWAHLLVGVYSLVNVVLDFACPLTRPEKYLRRKGGEDDYEGGYIQHYLEGSLWPEGATPTAEKVGFALLVISYVGFFVLRRRRRQRVPAAAARG
ncbi:conserved hypothetical protein [Kribbella flavida DSM 17836]|uniref:DUF2784 domain-containing protein n=1 Tax=Kribbella flavida (strain DSM 17836 / JCM 10339 / NBRC 14399) TaxID=479435 RepID=D2Q546_KRIFD|nr:DUF2784 domain-containing protein [Kribbella flavida]ADB36057.1 conserved hypothetical protein [Kribbella flavida DSM 17836]